MRILILIIAVLFSGCALNRVMAVHKTEINIEKCEMYGFKKGTESFKECVLKIEGAPVQNINVEKGFSR